MHRPEILAPAGSMECLLAALRCGADAVYAGGEMYSARSSAQNFDLNALAEAVRLCHLYGAKFYLAVNTLLTDSESEAFLNYMKKAAQCGIDACIVQDLGVLQMLRTLLPDMHLHASTQMSIHTPEGALQAAELGCSRVVAAREMSRQELRSLCGLPMEIEVFVHGALCMSVSGQCSFSALVGGRSANRGRCAQACRLPWRTPSGREPAALSLKDLSLVPHVQEMQKIGVSSFKIEGRMKRPEYVAAAVTALRKALDGEEPDMETLRAVFSRSGFTDGYYTGEKKDMFGFRRWEDVEAGKQVIQKLQGLYRNPRKMTELSFSAVLRKNVPAKLTAADGDGHRVTVWGEIPERALKVPLSEGGLQKSLSKLGDTIFSCGNVTLDNPDGLTLSAAACNALRRSAVDALCSSRTTLPFFHVQEVPGLPEGKTIPRTARFRWHVRTQAQLTAAVQQGGIACVPLRMGKELSSNVSIWLESPRIIADESMYKRQLSDLKEKGFSDLLCHNIADIRIGRQLGFTLHGGLGLNCTSRRTAQTLESLGVRDVTGSQELRMKNIAALGRTLPSGAFVYGRMPMMLFRLCPIRAQEGCRGNGCSLRDRTGQTFPLLCSGEYVELCNAQRLWLADKIHLLHDLSYWDFFLTQESIAEIAQIAQAYRNGSDRVPKDRTNGLYWKGGLV